MAVAVDLGVAKFYRVRLLYVVLGQKAWHADDTRVMLSDAPGGICVLSSPRRSVSTRSGRRVY